MNVAHIGGFVAPFTVGAPHDLTNGFLAGVLVPAALNAAIMPVALLLTSRQRGNQQERAKRVDRWGNVLATKCPRIEEWGNHAPQALCRGQPPEQHGLLLFSRGLKSQQDSGSMTRLMSGELLMRTVCGEWSLSNVADGGPRWRRFGAAQSDRMTGACRPSVSPR